MSVNSIETDIVPRLCLHTNCHAGKIHYCREQDFGNCFLTISAGSGPEECAHAAALILKALESEIAERQDISLRIIETDPSGEKVIISFSMAEGAVLGIGKGNAGWNYSAPYGSGSKKARTDARSLSLDEYRKEMRGIWSSVICKDTLEESPMAYKKPKDVLDYICETVEIEQCLRPLYNFKALD